MINLNTSMCGATANFPEAVMATLGGQLVVFDYTPDQAGGSGPGPYCEGYLPRDPQYAGMYEIFGYMPDDWYFFDGNSFNWYNDCSLINGVDGTAGFTIHGIAFQPESMPVVRTGSICRPAVRTVQQALSAATMLAPDPNRSHAASVVRLAVTRPIFRHTMAARFDSVPPAPTGFGNPTLDNLRPNLVCVWKLEEGAGTRLDVISGEDLSAHNAPGSAAGKDGLACVFNNAAANGLYRDLAQLGPLGAHESDTEIAFSTWVYANSVGYRSIAGFIDEMGGMGPWSLSLGYENRVYLNISTYNWNDYAYAQTGGLSAGQWYNLVFTFSATGHLRLYVNGSLVATNDTYSGTGGLAQPYSPFTIGCGQAYDYEHDTYGYGNSWDGLIDETCVWNAVPADPDTFAAALWNGGRGAFYRIDTTRRATVGMAAGARQTTDMPRRERFQALMEQTLTGTAVRLDAIARLVRSTPAARSTARAIARHNRVDVFRSISALNLNPVRTAVAHRAVVRRIVLASAGTDAHASARQSTIAIVGECILALAENVQTGMASRFEAVSYRYHQITANRPDARVSTLTRTPVGFAFIFGIDPTRATIAARPAAREMSGTGFGNSILDALMDRLVCCWKLEEGTGQRLDVISGENLTPHNTPTAGPGKDGQANRFSNAQANGLYRNLADLGPLATWGAGVELAVSTWLYADSLGYRSVLGFIDEMGYMGPWSMTVGYQNRLYVNIATPDWDNAYVQSGSLSAGQWYHVFFTYDASGNVRLYLNGVLAATGSTYSGNGGLAQPYSPFTLGCGQAYDYEHDTYGYGNSWDGLIDETCVWNAAPPDPDLFAVALWQAGRGSFLYLDPRHRAITTARGDLRATTATKKADRLLADQDLARAATPARALATRYTVEANSGAWADIRGRASDASAARADAEYIVALTRALNAVRPGVRRDLTVVECARTALGLDARARIGAAGAAFLKALVERLHAANGVRLGAGMKVTFAASGEVFEVRAVSRVTTGEHPGARHSLAWTIPHLTSARDTTGERTPVAWLARARHDGLHRVRLTMRAPQTAAAQARSDAFVRAGWRLVARDAATGDELDLGFLRAGVDRSGGTLLDVALPDGDWQIEPRPAEWLWSDCRGRAASSVSIRDGRILHAGLPAILNLRGDLSAAKEPARSGWSEQGERQILNQRRVVRWEIAAELLPQSFRFGIWTGTASPVQTTGEPATTVPFTAGRGSYFYAFAQDGPLYLAVVAFDAGQTGPVAEVFLDWASASPVSPANQLAR